MICTYLEVFPRGAYLETQISTFVVNGETKHRVSMSLQLTTITWSPAAGISNVYLIINYYVLTVMLI